jgi:DNA-binding CsgD family transcriptional regulator
MTYLNCAGLTLFGINVDDLEKGVAFTDFFDRNDRERFGSDMKMASQADIDKLYEYRFRGKGGNEFIGLFKSTPLYKENKIIGARAIITEVRTFLDLALMPDNRFYDVYEISEREKEVLLYVFKGYKNKDIGEKLFISERTVKKHIASILQKTNTYTRHELLDLVREFRKNE